MNKIKVYIAILPLEEKANTLTHLFPLIGACVLAWPMLHLAAQSAADAGDHIVRTINVIGTLLFLIGMLLMYGSSTFYHLIVAPVAKSHWRIFDHISIYVMIAGSYSLICMSVVGGWLGWTLFIFLWASVIVGIVSKLVALGKYPRLSLALYLAMGWVALLMIVPMWRNMSHAAFFWILAEGAFYTIGSYFFNKDEQHAYYHAIWHVFIVLGSAAHTIATWLILSN